jgi:hypothetical protein
LYLLFLLLFALFLMLAMESFLLLLHTLLLHHHLPLDFPTLQQLLLRLLDLTELLLLRFVIDHLFEFLFLSVLYFLELPFLVL